MFELEQTFTFTKKKSLRPVQESELRSSTLTKSFSFYFSEMKLNSLSISRTSF